MPSKSWDETNRLWDDDHGLLDDAQVEQCARADAAEPLRSPIPTRMVSNGEYMPIPQTNDQRRVEARVNELAEHGAKQLGMDRRRFLAGTGGMAASLVAMNEVFGRFFDVDPIEMLVPAAYAQSATPGDMFIFDDQLHLVRGTVGNAGASLRALAQGPTAGDSNPYSPQGLPD